MNQLKEVKGHKVYEFLLDTLGGLGFLPNGITRDVNLEDGKFYVIVPFDALEDDIYNFEVGGHIVPFHRENMQNPVQVINISKISVYSFIYSYLNSQECNCICLEDFNHEPNSKFIEKDVEFTIVNDHLFYLLDNSKTKEQINKYIHESNSWFLLGVLCKLNSDFIERYESSLFKELDTEVKSVIIKNVEAFFIKIYDGESFLFWIKNSREDLVEELSELIT